jgi:hypothetical protein
MATAADRCLLRLVTWIRPKRPAHGARTLAMFEQLRAEALAVGIELIRFAYAGSLEKGTGLRRYRDRECSIPGQAVDLVVELAPGEPPNRELHLQLQAVGERCFATVGQADDLDFRRDRLCWRLLPILAQRGPEGYLQWLLGPERATRTLVSAHTRDVRQRTRASIERVPNVGFNDCVRLLKWWHAARPPERALPSFVLERLAIVAFDRLGVYDGFAVTLATWAAQLEEIDPRTLVDPVGDGAPLLVEWTDRDCHALAQWWAEGAQILREAAASNEGGSDEGAVAEQLGVRMFGPAIVRAVTER